MDSSARAQQDQQRLGWYQQAKFGLFIHWGAYSVGGVEASWPIMTPQMSEVIFDTQISIEENEYVKLPARFNPADFDPHAWVQLAQEAGMRYIVITSKHHDGFCMFDAPGTEYKITNNFIIRAQCHMDQKKIIVPSSSGFLPGSSIYASMIAVLIPPLLMIWIAASIVAYASVAHHPNPKVVHYNRFAGYRFYGVAGTMVALGQLIYGLFNNWHGLLAIWAIFAAVVIPWGIRDLLRVQRENWQDMEIEIITHE